MERERHIEFIVLGGGTAGLTAAKAVAREARQVALIDPTPVGGLCALRGCNPKKILVRASEVLQEIRKAPHQGVRTGSTAVEWERVLARMRGFTAPVSQAAEQSLRRSGIEYIAAAPRFTGPDRLRVQETELTFDGALVAVGSQPRKLEIPGREYLANSDEVLEKHVPPRTMAVIGAGPVAFEYGQMFARLGSRVHMLVRSSALKAMDAEVVERLVAYSERLGMHFHYGIDVSAIEKHGSVLAVVLNRGQRLEVDYVLNATGRVLASDELDLPKGDIAFSPKGIQVDEHLRSTSNARVFAAGDAHGRINLTPVASYEGRLVAHNFLGKQIPETADYSAVPSAVFTVPALASVGMTEEQAREQGIDYAVKRADMSEWTVFSIADKGPAYGKVVYENSSGRLIGAHLYGPEAENTIHIFAMALRYGIARQQLKEMTYVYPSLGSVAQFLV